MVVKIMEELVFSRDKTTDREKYRSLLMEADEDSSMLDKYFQLGHLFVGKKGTEIVCVAILLPESELLIELKNIAVSPKYRRQGVGHKFLAFLSSYYQNQYQEMLVGTGDVELNNLAFYLQNGFRFDGIRKNFYTQYSHLIEISGLQLKDMILLRKPI